MSAIKMVVHVAAVRSTMEQLEHPRGRRPTQRILALSHWFNELPPSDRERLQEVIELAVHDGVFALLAVLDGVRSIEEGPNHGRLELSHIQGGEREVLTKPNGVLLHEIYSSQVYGQVFGTVA
jgi:hypothetical protein